MLRRVGAEVLGRSAVLGRSGVALRGLSTAGGGGGEDRMAREPTRGAYGVKRKVSLSDYKERRNKFGTTGYLAEPKTLSVVGAPLCMGQPLMGVDQGPQKLREAGLLTDLRSLEWQIEDYGDIEFDMSDARVLNGPDGLAKHAGVVGAANEKIRDHVLEQASLGKCVLTLGGDHSIACGSVAGAAQAREPGELGIIWIDAHADINHPATSPSGNLHGMPVAFLMGLVEAGLVPGFDWLPTDAPVLQPEQLVYIGACARVCAD